MSLALGPPVSATVTLLTSHVLGTGHGATAAFTEGTGLGDSSSGRTGYSIYYYNAWSLRTDINSWAGGQWGCPVAPIEYDPDLTPTILTIGSVGTIVGTASTPDKFSFTTAT